MIGVSERVQRRVRVDFPQESERVVGLLAGLTVDVFPDHPRDSAPVERIQVAALVAARGDWRRLDDAIALGRADWRDLLVAAGMANENWRDLLEAELARTPDRDTWTARLRRKHNPR